MSNLKTIIVLVLLMTTTLFYGQRPDRDKIKSLKIAFFTEQLELSSSEAESFWPVYNQYQRERHSLRKQGHSEIRNKMKETEGLSEKEANDLLSQYLDYEEEEEELDKNFLIKVSKIISAKKTLKLLKAEEDFKRKLIQQYRKKRGGGGHR